MLISVKSKQRKLILLVSGHILLPLLPQYYYNDVWFPDACTDLHLFSLQTIYALFKFCLSSYARSFSSLSATHLCPKKRSVFFLFFSLSRNTELLSLQNK